MARKKTLDHTDFYEKGKKPNSTKEGESHQWWKRYGEDLAKCVFESVELLAKNQEARLKQNLISTRLYGNLAMMGPSGLSFSKLSSVQFTLRDRISYNVVQSAIDTIVSKTTKNKPKPFFLTSGGDYRQQRRAKKLNKFIEGVFHETKAYEFGQDAMRDGCVWGDGFVHVFAKNGRVAYERVLPQELWVDELEAFYGYPRTMSRCKNVDREQLKDEYPRYAAEIDRAEMAKPDTSGTYGTACDLVTIAESWHLPSGADATDGKHVICIDNCVLFEEEYEKDFFPFARFAWWKRPFGYWSQGLAEQIQNIQLEINKLLTVIQRSYHLGGSFKILLENGSKVVKEHLNNDVGSIIMYSGTKPEYVVPPLVPPEIYNHLKTLRDSAYEQAGVSQLSASAKKPEGIESGKALRAFNDIESERFISVGHAYESFFLQLAKLSIETAKDIAGNKKAGYAVKAPGKSFFQTINWREIDLQDDAFVMQVFPISSLPNDPAGRLQTVQEYIQAGFVTQRQGKRLLEFPDLESVEGLSSASEDYCSMILDKIVDDGVNTPPDPFDNHELMLEMALEYYQRGKTQDLEPEKLDLLRRFIEAVKELINKAQQPEAPPVEPVAPPTPVPPSDIVPNVPMAGEPPPPAAPPV